MLGGAFDGKFHGNMFENEPTGWGRFEKSTPQNESGTYIVIKGCSL